VARAGFGVGLTCWTTGITKVIAGFLAEQVAPRMAMGGRILIPYFSSFYLSSLCMFSVLQ
jgi:hypothetical protein